MKIHNETITTVTLTAAEVEDAITEWVETRSDTLPPTAFVGISPILTETADHDPVFDGYQLTYVERS